MLIVMLPHTREVQFLNFENLENEQHKRGILIHCEAAGINATRVPGICNTAAAKL
jgi:hypothetical protein